MTKKFRDDILYSDSIRKGVKMELFTRGNYTINLNGDKVGNEEDILIDLEDRLSEDTEENIQDIITDVADTNVEFYPQAIWDLAPTIKNWIEQALIVIDLRRGDDLDRLFMFGQYLYNMELINYNLDYIIHNLACDILEDLVEEEFKSGELSNTDIEKLGDSIADYLQLADIRYKSDIVESMESLLEDFKNGGL